ncbi:epigen [Pseudophryne corroboree]|uniref:epigen n=1 Tax=Pseudophryne corroboree TaxID=495146 RepID=UPI0030814CD5
MTVLSEEPSTPPSAEDNERSLTKDRELENMTQREFPCQEEYSSFCINGVCVFHKAVDTPICRCSYGYTGERCEHVILAATYGNEMETTYIAIGIAVGLLISGLIAFIWCYREKRYEKKRNCHVLSSYCKSEFSLGIMWNGTMHQLQDICDGFFLPSFVVLAEFSLLIDTW